MTDLYVQIKKIFDEHYGGDMDLGDEEDVIEIVNQLELLSVSDKVLMFQADIEDDPENAKLCEELLKLLVPEYNSPLYKVLEELDSDS